ncbi:LLM class flavin-dependent oxidoreductase [Microtetraspora sp. NBRC 16547]|uniref:LLM class flavin-dependent oxidoreductase n=1 Tax=Microtetraspora sp. NBRC 16547 TaxID=3030993 RepID=UPI0024A12555|nr:LLM class flavin-dependent oxidoreductase [Microtetraspora sp. NBRC 16547]GLW99370.1 LLM class F420-dependent oxidoreductase [Microtetraspora sp. NBRC 16547]
MSIRVGVRIPACQSLIEFGEAVKEVEQRGFSAVWVPDSQLLWRDTYAAMAFAAAATSTIQLGTGVSNLRTRHPSVVASAVNTVVEIAPGRVRLALGTGDSAVKLIGERPSRQVETREGVELVRTLLSGNDWKFGGREVHLRDAQGVVPIILAASGPKNVALAGEIGDGALLLGGASARLVEQNIVRLQEGAARVGRSLDGFETVVAAFCHVTDEPERDAGMLKPLCATVVLTGGAAALQRAGIEIDPARIPPAAYPDYSHAEDLDDAIARLDDVISDEVALRFAEEFCLFGPAAIVTQRIQELERAGVTEVYLRHLGSYEVPHALIDDVAGHVLPALRASDRFS